MSKKATKTPKAEPASMRAEYALEYSKAKPNRFAGRVTSNVVAVVLEPDVASVVRTSVKANAMLRSVIASRAPRKRTARPLSHRRKVG